MIHFLAVEGLDIPELEVYAKLSEVQLKRFYEPHGGLFIAESPKVVLRALDAGCVPVSLLTEEKHIRTEAAEVLARCAAREEEIPVYTGTYDVLTGLTGYALTRGVLCAMLRPPLRSARSLLGGLSGSCGSSGTGGPGIRGDAGHGPRRPAPARIAVLENVMNPANVGSIFRNAAALGMDAVLLTPGCCDPLYRRALRVSMGTSLQIPWAWIGSGPEDWRQNGLKLLREYGYRTIAMALRTDAVEMQQLSLGAEEKAAVILGAEGDGLLPETIRDADIVVRIPMMRGVDSLNVAAASAVAFYQITAGGL